MQPFTYETAKIFPAGMAGAESYNPYGDRPQTWTINNYLCCSGY